MIKASTLAAARKCHAELKTELILIHGQMQSHTAHLMELEAEELQVAMAITALEALLIPK